MKNEKLTDIIIVNLNGLGYLPKCFSSIYKHSTSNAFRIVVVDNGSTDGSQAWIKAKFPETVLVQNTSNVGFSTACNQGIKASSGQYIFLLNNDTQFLNDVIASLLEFFANHEDVGLVGPLTLFPDGRLQASIKHFPSPLKFVAQQLGLPTLAGYKEELYYPFGPFRRSDYERTHSVEWLSGACLLFRRELFDEIGPLDENMPFGMEDMDYARRARAAGKLNYFVREARIIHHKGGTREDSARREKNSFVRMSYRKGIIEYFKKYYSWPSYLTVRTSIWTGDLIKSLSGYYN